MNGLAGLLSGAKEKLAGSGLIAGAPSTGGIAGQNPTGKPQGGMDMTSLMRTMMMQQMMRPGANAGPQDYLSNLVGLLSMGGLGDKQSPQLINPDTGRAAQPGGNVSDMNMPGMSMAMPGDPGMGQADIMRKLLDSGVMSEMTA